MRPCDRVIEAMFYIVNKQAVKVPFVLNKVQQRYSQSATSRDIILKARREGFSSYIRGEFLTACMIEDNTRAVILSQDTDATQKHLDAVRYHIKYMKGANLITGYNSRNEISFPKTDSTFYIGTAGSKSFGRGDTITHLHLSEVAFYTDLKALQAGVMQAAAHAKHIVLESTANGFNEFQRWCYRALRGEGDFALHFFAWYEDPDNVRLLLNGDKLKWPEAQDKREELQLMQETYQLSDEQMNWYLHKRQEFMDNPDDVEGELIMRQEYPFTIEEAFISTGAQIFRQINYVPLEPTQDGKTLIYVEPKERHKYVIGVDYSGGNGQDFGLIQVIDADKMEQVAMYRDNFTDPERLSQIAARLADKYNKAFIVPEANNHGTLGVDVLKRMYPVSRIFQREVPDRKNPSNQGKMKKTLGYLTTEKTKFYLVNSLKVYLKRGLIIHSGITNHELRIFEEIDGSLQAPEGEHDDCTMALGLATVGIHELVKRVRLEPEAPKPKPEGVLYPFANMDDLTEIAKNTAKGRRMINSFYSPHDAGIILTEMKRMAHG